MVSLDEQIQKDRQKNKGQKPNRNQSQDRHKKFNRGPSDKHRGIKKADHRKEGGKFRRNRDDRQERGPKKFNREVRQGVRQRGGKRGSRISRISRDKQVRGKIPRTEKPPRKVSNENDDNAAQEKGRTLKVMGLHPDFTNEDLYKLFSTEGALQKCLIEQDNFGRSLTTAIVKYHNASSAKSAIANLNQHKVMNSILTVEPYKNKRK